MAKKAKRRPWSTTDVRTLKTAARKKTRASSIARTLKRSEGAPFLWFRSAAASMLSQIVDTCIFITIAFYGVFPIGELLLGQMIAKLVLSGLLVPPLVYAFISLGKRLDATHP